MEALYVAALTVSPVHANVNLKQFHLCGIGVFCILVNLLPSQPKSE